MQDKKDEQHLVQRTINANSLVLLRVLVDKLKLNCSGCHLHGIVAEAPFDLSGCGCWAVGCGAEADRLWCSPEGF